MKDGQVAVTLESMTAIGIVIGTATEIGSEEKGENEAENVNPSVILVLDHALRDVSVNVSATAADQESETVVTGVDQEHEETEAAHVTEIAVAKGVARGLEQTAQVPPPNVQNVAAPDVVTVVAIAPATGHRLAISARSSVTNETLPAVGGRGHGHPSAPYQTGMNLNVAATGVARQTAILWKRSGRRARGSEGKRKPRPTWRSKRKRRTGPTDETRGLEKNVPARTGHEMTGLETAVRAMIGPEMRGFAMTDVVMIGVVKTALTQSSRLTGTSPAPGAKGEGAAAAAGKGTGETAKRREIGATGIATVTVIETGAETEIGTDGTGTETGLAIGIMIVIGIDEGGSGVSRHEGIDVTVTGVEVVAGVGDVARFYY